MLHSWPELELWENSLVPTDQDDDDLKVSTCQRNTHLLYYRSFKGGADARATNFFVK
jgi:hypothetical protein